MTTKNEETSDLILTEQDTSLIQEAEHGEWVVVESVDELMDLILKPNVTH